MLMELWMEEEENMRKAEEFKIRRRVMIYNIPAPTYSTSPARQPSFFIHADVGASCSPRFWSIRRLLGCPASLPPTVCLSVIVFHPFLRAAAIIRSWVRRMVKKYGVKAQRVAAARIQRAWLRRARNRWLSERVRRVFAIARSGDVDGMMRELRANPDVLFMRDRCGVVSGKRGVYSSFVYVGRRSFGDDQGTLFRRCM